MSGNCVLGEMFETKSFLTRSLVYYSSNVFASNLVYVNSRVIDV